MSINLHVLIIFYCLQQLVAFVRLQFHSFILLSLS